MATKSKDSAAAADAAPASRVPMAVPEGGWPADEFTGIGGQYVRDPFTGVRSPAVDPAAAAVAVEPAADGAAAAQ